MAEYSTELNPEPQVSYLTSDHLGSPRIVTDGGGRSSAQGYGKPDDVRKQYTGYERDKESGLDYAQARYYNSNHGRFTSVDPLTASASIRNPQTFNRYTYVLNSPYKFTDPLGLIPQNSGSACGQFCQNSIGGGYNGGTAFDLTGTYQYDSLWIGGSDVHGVVVSKQSDFGRFEETGTGILPFVEESFENFTGNKAEIDGKKVFVKIFWSATVGQLYIKGTNTPVTAYKNPGKIQYLIVDQGGNEIGGKEAKELKKQAEQFGKDKGYTNAANCHGTTFADGKYWIGNDQLIEGTLNKMGYDKVTDGSIMENDVGIYNDGGEYVHSVRFNSDTTTVRGKGGIQSYQSNIKLSQAWNHPGDLEVWRKIPQTKK